jgi:hypothetical protein
MARVGVERRSAMVESSSHGRAQTSREQPQSWWRSRASHGREQSTRVATAQPRAAVVEISSHGEQQPRSSREQPWAATIEISRGGGREPAVWCSSHSREQPQLRAATAESSPENSSPRSRAATTVESSRHDHAGHDHGDAEPWAPTSKSPSRAPSTMTDHDCGCCCSRPWLLI